MSVLIDVNQCVGCGLCSSDCPARNIRIVNGKASVLGRCMECGHCFCVCPQNAVTLTSYDLNESEPCADTVGLLEPNALLKALKCRRSIRQFTDQPIGQEQVRILLEAGHYAPTGSNAQDVRYILLQNKLDEATSLVLSVLKEMGEAILAADSAQTTSGSGRFTYYANSWIKMEQAYRQERKDALFFHAPLVIVFAAKSPVNAALASANVAWMANSLGIGSVYIGFLSVAAQDPRVKEYLGLRKGETAACCLALGYPGVAYRRTAPRKEPDVVQM